MTTATNMTAKESNKNIDRLVGLVAGNLERYRQYVGEAALAIMAHAKAFDDCDKARSLVAAVNPRDRTALVGWLASVSPIRVSKGDAEGTFKAKMVKGNREFDFEKATESAWWSYGKEPREVTLKDVLGLYDGLLKSLEMTDAKLSKYNTDSRETVKAEAAKLSAFIGLVRARLATEQHGGSDNSKDAARNMFIELGLRSEAA